MSTRNQLPENKFSAKNPKSFDPKNGVANLFAEFDDVSSFGISRTFQTHDEANPDLDIELFSRVSINEDIYGTTDIYPCPYSIRLR